MGWLFSIFLFVVGAMAVYPAVVQTWPASRQLLDKLMPYQGVIGIVATIWGLISALRLLSWAGSMMHFAPIIWVLSLAGALLAIALGLLFGYSLIASNVLSNNPQFQRRGEDIRAKLLARQGPLGWGAMIVGAVNFLMLLVR